MASQYDRTINVNESVETEVNALLVWNRVSAKVNGEPAWFVENTDTNGYATFFTITAPLNGTYTYQVEIWFKNNFVEFATLTLVVGETFNDIDICCDSQVNLVWLNRQGGWQNYIFTQRVDYQVEVGNAKTFINNGIIKYSDRGRVYNAVTLYAKGITKTEIDYLDTLRYSIQAYEFNQTTLEFIPILVDSSSFNKYNSKENMYEVNISFKYATQLDIQKQ